jgi:hypothetical protein
MGSRTSKGKDPLAFGPVMTWEQIHEAEREWAVTRHIALAALTRSGHQLAEGAWKDGDTFLEILKQAMDYQGHAKAALEVAECAVARLITIGNVLSEGNYHA